MRRADGRRHHVVILTNGPSPCTTIADRPGSARSGPPPSVRRDVTGRYAPQELIDRADLVTEMRE